MIKCVCDHCGKEVLPCDICVVNDQPFEWHLCHTCCEEYNKLDVTLKQHAYELQTKHDEARYTFLSGYRWLSDQKEIKEN